jgi:hypothetical protein
MMVCALLQRHYLAELTVQRLGRSHRLCRCNGGENTSPILPRIGLRLTYFHTKAIKTGETGRYKIQKEFMRCFMGKLKGKKPDERSRYRWENNIKMDFKQ